MLQADQVPQADCFAGHRSGRVVTFKVDHHQDQM
jgi:hypothetical protein